jgi:hypothetical protein
VARLTGRAGYHGLNPPGKNKCHRHHRPPISLVVFDRRQSRQRIPFLIFTDPARAAKSDSTIANRDVKRRASRPRGIKTWYTVVRPCAQSGRGPYPRILGGRFLEPQEALVTNQSKQSFVTLDGNCIDENQCSPNHSVSSWTEAVCNLSSRWMVSALTIINVRPTNPFRVRPTRSASIVC